ncbi:hypothetical protein TNIN_147691 [Trichonephila inaurata madagascariensis]|uniref:Uncharacterized protein n=1 Tax=Trichonephila inaurata madagascariensis TaxID=2747483 RepID=A0A8X6IA58_9ARAC|nr:hypothetical protein TNIN_147691 [Trichonephila inaurata madagascariensis]
MELYKNYFLCFVSVFLAGLIDARPSPQAANLDPSTVQKIKTLISKLNIDPSQIDFNSLNLAHKYDGKDSLQPSMCDDSINDRYGVGKHRISKMHNTQIYHKKLTNSDIRQLPHRKCPNEIIVKQNELPPHIGVDVHQLLLHHFTNETFISCDFKVTWLVRSPGLTSFYFWF